MKGYTQIKKDVILKAVLKFEEILEESRVVFKDFTHQAKTVKQDFTVSWWIFKRKKSMTQCEYWARNGMFWVWRDVAPARCMFYLNYLNSDIVITEYKHQALIAEDYVNCDTELSDFVYKYLNWEEK